MKYNRYLQKQVSQDLKEKMVFLGGPRQVGKTSLSKQVFRKKKATYLNWDYADDRTLILKGEWPPQMPHLILDEVQPAGKKSMSGKSFLAGARHWAGE